MIDVCVCTLGKREPLGLRYVPDRFRLITSGLAPWPVAANDVLDRSENDVLFIDDDIEFLPDSFSHFQNYKERADILGFSLHHPANGTWELQNAGCMYFADGNRNDSMEGNEAHYIAHVTASCMYIHRRVVQSGLRFPVWDGVYSEDLAFTLEAWLRGFRVAHIPGVVRHHMKWSEVGLAGSEKAGLGNLRADWKRNREHLARWESDRDITGRVRLGVIPNGRIKIQ
jgi:GT2 family glycosyltransferase